MEKIIEDLVTMHSCGNDGISANFIKLISGIISGRLAVIINRSFKVPLKIANVIPTFKKGDPHVFG